MNVSRALRVTVFALAALMSGSALANGPAIVVELDSGRVLHADRATDPWFPASITKLMTAYVALDKVRSGQMSMDTLLTVTDSAAALQDGVQAGPGGHPRQRAQDHHGQVGERRRRDHRGESRRLH